MGVLWVYFRVSRGCQTVKGCFNWYLGGAFHSLPINIHDSLFRAVTFLSRPGGFRSLKYQNVRTWPVIFSLSFGFSMNFWPLSKCLKKDSCKWSPCSIPDLPGKRGQKLDEEGHWQAKFRPGIIIVKSGQVVATQLRPNISPVLFTRNSSWSKESAMHADLTIKLVKQLARLHCICKW